MTARPAARHSTHQAAIVPGARIRYLAEIADTARGYKRRALEQAAIARQARVYGQPVRGPACIITGGETTVTIRGDGKGGRNQEFALAQIAPILFS